MDTGDREVKFVFDDDAVDLVDVEDEMQEESRTEHMFELQAQTASLLKSIQDGLQQSTTAEEVQQLNNQLVDFQSKILAASTERLEAKEKQNKNVFQMVETAECVDLVFVMDATRSMKSMFHTVKDNIRAIIREIKRTNPTLKLRLGVVVYRDLFYDQRYQVLDFVESTQVFEDFICSLEAPRAPVKRDIPEDMAIGIQQANRLSWSQPTRIAFIVADQACHGFEFHNHPDNFPLGTPNIDVKKELRELISKSCGSGSMSVYFGRIGRHTDTMISRLKHYGIVIKQVKFSTTSIISSVTEGVRSSVFKTVTTLKTTEEAGLLLNEDEKMAIESIPRPVFQRAYEIVDRQLVEDEWGALPYTEVVVYKTKPFVLTRIRTPVSVGRMNPKRSQEGDFRNMMLRRAPFPFAEGSTRIAYHALLSRGISVAPFPVILKTFKFMGLNVNDRKHYLRQMEASNLASLLAKRYSDSSARPPHAGLVHVLKVSVVEEQDATNESGLNRFCAEQPLPTDGSKFTRFSSNTGYWNESELSETLLRFCKYTYDVSNGYLIVTDLQGIKRGNDFFLTDPVILCQNPLRFGATNVGLEFMKRCIDSTNHFLSLNGWMDY